MDHFITIRKLILAYLVALSVILSKIRGIFFVGVSTLITLPNHLDDYSDS